MTHVYDPSIQEVERIKDLRMLIIAWPTNTYRSVLVNSFKMGVWGAKKKGKIYVHGMQNYVCLLKQVEEEGVCVEHTHVFAAHILTYC